ncbi:MAG TPA: hypothetical protein VF489_08460 [Sphingobium sp.]
MRGVALTLLAGALLTGHSAAAAQGPALSNAIRFTLKPQPVAFIGARRDPAERARINPLAQVSANDRAHELTFMVRRQKARLLRSRSLSSLSPINPYSRFILVAVEDRAPLGDLFTLVTGFQGMKLSNRHANVTTLDGNTRLRTHDWLMPYARVEITPGPALGLAISYRETIHAYGDTGVTGPLGLTRGDFQSLAARLRPESRSRLRIDAGWAPAQNVTMRMTAYGGRIDDRLSFVDRTYLPVNSGSARLHGISMAIEHRLSPNWRWSMRYNAARFSTTEGARGTEEGVTLEATWANGPWSATLRGAQGSRPAPITPDHDRSRRRIEGEIRYQLPSEAPACVTLRLTDPDRFAGTALLREEFAGPLHATDQARGLMLGADIRW